MARTLKGVFREGVTVTSSLILSLVIAIVLTQGTSR